ncbi:MAG TPA: ABC transporter ATP-binding protein, partial [Oligoflexia bacterium]|nr:ABC transporter ATP-binding protein [Oligoflexia bacterium]
GESFGFLGHNGAGKTTTIKCITGLIHPTSGRILLDGEDLRKPQQRFRLGFLPEQPYFYDHLTVEETMRFFAALLGLPRSITPARISECLHLFGIADRAQSNVRTLSKGLQQRLGLAQSILNRPQLLLLDEPFSGLDPIGRREVREALLALKNEGTTIFMSSHILSDVQDLCDRVAVMARGELRSVFSLADIPRLFGEAFELRVTLSTAAESVLTELRSAADDWKTTHTLQEEIHSFRFADYLTAHRALGDAVGAGLRINGFEHIAPDLETVFVKITQAASAANGGGR